MIRSASLFLGLSLVLVISGCSTIVREAQRSKSSKATSSAVVEGQELKMTLALSLENANEKGAGFLAGRATVTALSGEMPPSLDLYHFQVFTEGFSALTNYRRDRSGKWVSLDRYPQGQPSVFVNRSKTNLVMEFHLADRRRSTGTYSIALSLSDSKMQRHILTASADAKASD